MRTEPAAALCVALVCMAMAAYAAPEAQHYSRQHVELDVPKAAAIDDTKPGRIEITAPGMAKVVIVVEDTTATNMEVSVHDRSADHVRYQVGVFKRFARCEASGEGLYAAEAICKSMRVEPGRREPRIQISVDGTGVKDLAAYKHALEALEPKLAACWKAAATADADLNEGAVIIVRQSRPDQNSPRALTGTSKMVTFLHGDPEPLKACMFPLLESVPATLAKTASLSTSVGCSL